MEENTKLIFDAPATDFLEAIPIGNGRIGAMIYGEVLREQVILNESSMWSGSREEANRKDALVYLPQIRKLLKDGQNYEAEQLFAEHFTCQGRGSNFGHGSDAPYGCYQVLGRLHLSYFQAISSGREWCYAVENYLRSLDLVKGTSKIEFTIRGTDYRREWIVSKSQEALYMNLTASKKGRISFSLGLDRDECYDIEKIDDTTIRMTGQLDDGWGKNQGITYACAVSVVVCNGIIKKEKHRVHVSNADEATVIITIRTDLAGFMGRKKVNPKEAVLLDMEKARMITYQAAKEEYTAWYQSQSLCMELKFGNAAVNEQLPTPERIKRFVKGERDPGLIALYVQFAKHQMIASSQKGEFAANLQGLWSDEVQTPWNGDWHLNAQQQIYWLVEKAGLSENHLPFIELTKALVEPGEETAKKYYGSRGWIVHTMTNPWGFTAPLEDSSWGSTTGSSAWQCHHLFEHYLYTRDAVYLRSIYPVMKGAAEFFMDMLVEDRETGYLVTSPSSSPENVFLDNKGRRCSLCEGPSYDRALVRALFDYCMQAQYILQDDDVSLSELKEKYDRLAPIEIASDGRIKEWGKEYPEILPFHRHLSHLWGVYPGNQISYEKTPGLARAAEKTLIARGRTTAGWAIGYRLCLAARLRNPVEGMGYLRDTFKMATSPNLMNLAYHCSENLLHHKLPEIGTAKHQFQLDGNQANAAGVLLFLMDDDARVMESGEMDVQIHLLPALPEELDSGSIKGLCAKGKINISMSWKNGLLIHAALNGIPETTARVRYREEERHIIFDKEGRYIW